MRKIAIILACVALSGCSSTSPKCVTATPEGLVDALKPQESLRAMLKQALERTETFPIIKLRHPGAADEALSAAIDHAVNVYGGEWRHNLISGWSSLNKNEVVQACDALSAGDRAKFYDFMNRVGPEVKIRNQPLLIRVASEALASMMKSPGL